MKLFRKSIFGDGVTYRPGERATLPTYGWSKMARFHPISSSTSRSRKQNANQTKAVLTCQPPRRPLQRVYILLPSELFLTPLKTRRVPGRMAQWEWCCLGAPLPLLILHMWVPSSRAFDPGASHLSSISLFQFLLSLVASYSQ